MRIVAVNEMIPGRIEFLPQTIHGRSYDIATEQPHHVQYFKLLIDLTQQAHKTHRLSSLSF